MTPPREVLERFPGLPRHCRWFPIRQAGFSGALLWRGELEGEPLFALKCHPADYPFERIQQIHIWWKLAERLPFVPSLLGAIDRWELCRWMPGTPVRSINANDPKLASACDAILQLHDLWKPLHTSGPIPALRRRMELLHSWNASAEFGLRAEAQQLLLSHRPAVIRNLLDWVERRFPLQPVLADVHAEHVLFTGNDVTGVIDFAAMKFDHVAVDAARYLGDTCVGHGEAFQRGCERFAKHHGGDVCPPELVELLDRSGTLAAIAYWLIRNEQSPEAAVRLARQMERWNRLAPIL